MDVRYNASIEAMQEVIVYNQYRIEALKKKITKLETQLKKQKTTSLSISITLLLLDRVLTRFKESKRSILITRLFNVHLTSQ